MRKGDSKMTEISKQIVDGIQEKNFWKTSKWVCYTSKYNERIISFMGHWTGNWNIPVVNLTPGDCLAQDNRLIEWQKTQPFFKEFMERICLCLNYCKDKTNEELKEIVK